jgi:thiamine-phosphate pyrophosphorylase
MADRCLLYYITDRTQFPGAEHLRRRALVEKIAEAARAGIDYIQLREKDLSTRDLQSLAEDAVRMIREARTANTEQQTALLLNSRTDAALAAGADGVHLRSDDVSPVEVRRIWDLCGAGAPAREKPIIATSCHSIGDVDRAQSQGADFAVFAPVFGKNSAPGVRATGLATLQKTCRGKIPVVALGGVTMENVASCLNAGAAGIAGIRLFQENKIEDIVRTLRAL